MKHILVICPTAHTLESFMRGFELADGVHSRTTRTISSPDIVFRFICQNRIEELLKGLKFHAVILHPLVRLTDSEEVFVYSRIRTSPIKTPAES